MLDRIDDDTHEVGTLLRQSVWMALRTTMAAGPLWLVAGLTWWPAFLLFPVSGLAALLVVRRMLPRAHRSARWSRRWPGPTTPPRWRRASPPATTSARVSVSPTCCAGAPSSPARCTSGSRPWCGSRPGIGRRTGMLLHGVLAATALVGVVLVVDDRLSTASLVTLFLVTTMFVGQVDQLARHLPDLQEGFGAVIRLRGLLASEPEPEGGLALPDGPLVGAVRRPPLRLRPRHLRAVRTSTSPCPPVRRAPSSGAPDRASPPWLRCVSRAVEPERGSLLLGGVDVRDARPPAAPRGGRRRHPAHGDPGRHPLREHHALRRAPARDRGGRDRRAGPRPPGSRVCPAGSTPCSGPVAPACRPARSSWSRSRGCWSATSGWSCSTRRPPGWTRSPRRAWSPPPTGCCRVAPACWSLTGSRRRSAPSRSPCSTAAASCSTALATSSPTATARSATCSTASAGESALRPVDAGLHTGAVGTAPTYRGLRRRRRRWTPIPSPGPRHQERVVHRAAVGPGRHGAVPGLCPHRGLRRDHRLAVGPHRRRPPAGRAPRHADRAPGGVAARVARCCWPIAIRRYPQWWIAVMLRARTRVLHGQTQAAPARAHAAGRGRGPHHGRRPPGALRRPLGRLPQRPRDRGGHRDRRASSALAGGVLLGRDDGRPRSPRRSADRSPGAPRRHRPRLGPASAGRWSRRSTRSARSSSPRRRPTSTATCARSTVAAWTRPSASTACRRCSTASRS